MLLSFPPPSGELFPSIEELIMPDVFPAIHLLAKRFKSCIWRMSRTLQ
jgi:hypothetical protein